MSAPVKAKHFERFHIHTRNAPLPAHVPRIFVLRKETCVNCGICVSACVYGVHHRLPSTIDATKVAEPEHEKCVACHRCVNECPMDALELSPHPAFGGLGDPYHVPELVETLVEEATTGRVPVSGQGYRGPFAGPGFDSIWTDMSEIVRPTRDGIHGRESISTDVQLGRRPERLEFDGPDLAGELPPLVPLALPVLLACPRTGVPKGHSALLAKAAHDAGTLALLPLSELEPSVAPSVGARLSGRETDGELAAAFRCRLVEIDDSSAAGGLLARLKRLQPGWVVSVRLPLSADSARRAVELARSGAGSLHLAADDAARASDGRFLADALKEAEKALVEAGLRDSVSIVVSGGIARAEHLPKAMICGADAVAIDLACLYALGWRGPASAFELPDPELGVQRLKNLLNAWRDQLLEVLGAMGMRAANRLQGESGRAMFFADLEAEFQALLKKPAPIGPSTSPGRAAAKGAIPDSVNVVPVKSDIWRTIAKYKVSYTKDCIDCGLCVQACPYGVHEREPGKLAMSTPVSESCIGPSCETKHPFSSDAAVTEGFCVPACPYDAIEIRPNPEWETLGDSRWTGDLLSSTWHQAEHGSLPKHADFEHRKGRSGGGFDRLEFAKGPERRPPEEAELLAIDTSLDLNRRPFGPKVTLPIPWYGGGMSYGSVGLSTMLSRARAAKAWGTFTSTGEGGYPPELLPYKDSIVTQVATGMFGVREDTIAASRFVEIKYAQGAKPGLGGHLLADKNTPTVASLRETVPGISLFSPFPFHSVYSVEDHRKHVDWLRATAEALRGEGDVLVSAKVSTPSDVDMVAVGCYYGGVNVIHLDGSYGGTGAAPDIAKKNIAMPIEYAIPKVHRFLSEEGIRDEVTLIASGGLRSAHDIAKAIALGADGVVLGTSDLVAVQCTRCGNCESGRGCQHGIASTDPVLSRLWTDDYGAQRIVNLYYSYRMELARILHALGLSSVRELRGRTDLLVYAPPEPWA